VQAAVDPTRGIPHGPGRRRSHTRDPSRPRPPRRHKLISEFQSASAVGPKVFIVTYATAAVGITLTAASRIFLMEPSLDPAQDPLALDPCCYW
jgi:SNF2 family DNA or RNA helicase